MKELHEGDDNAVRVLNTQIIRLRSSKWVRDRRVGRAQYLSAKPDSFFRLVCLQLCNAQRVELRGIESEVCGNKRLCLSVCAWIRLRLLAVPVPVSMRLVYVYVIMCLKMHAHAYGCRYIDVRACGRVHSIFIPVDCTT